MSTTTLLELLDMPSTTPPMRHMMHMLLYAHSRTRPYSQRGLVRSYSLVR